MNKRQSRTNEIYAFVDAYFRAAGRVIIKAPFNALTSPDTMPQVHFATEHGDTKPRFLRLSKEVDSVRQSILLLCRLALRVKRCYYWLQDKSDDQADADIKFVSAADVMYSLRKAI